MRNVFTADYWIHTFSDLCRNAANAAVQIAVIVLVFLAVRFLLHRAVGKAMHVVRTREEAVGRSWAAVRAATLEGVLKSVSSYVLIFIVAIMILRALGVDPSGLLTTAGVLGLAVGFGAQKLVRDVISGFFILLENQYAVGEYVTIGAATGVVEEVGMRTTTMRDDLGRAVIIPNGDVAQVTNHSRGSVVVSLDVSVAAGSDLDRVCAVLQKVGQQVARERADVLQPFVCDGVSAMDAAKVTLRVVGRVAPKAQRDIETDLRARVRAALIANRIDIA